MLKSTALTSSVAARGEELITYIFCRNLERYLQGRFDEMENILDKARMYRGAGPGVRSLPLRGRASWPR